MSVQEMHDSLNEKIGKLEERLRAVEDFKNMIRGALIFAGVAFAGMTIQAIYLIFSLNKDVAVHASRLATCESELKSKTEKLESNLKNHQEGIDRLRRYIVVLYDRQPKAPPAGVEALVHHGKIIELSKKTITILPDELGYPAMQFNLPKDIRVRIVGRKDKASIEDLHQGMIVAINPQPEHDWMYIEAR